MVDFVIIHFQPIEMYPPILNLINLLDSRGCKVKVVTTRCKVREYGEFKSELGNVSIKRTPGPEQGLSGFFRLLRYLRFYYSAFLSLVSIRPSKVMYYETLSMFPVYIYKKLVQRNAKILVHYHEYTSMKEYQSGMRLVKYFHSLERSFYRDCNWISHTNSLRMDLFVKDEGIRETNRLRVMPNYPPRAWGMVEKTGECGRIRFVYVGALSLSTMYLKEFIDWMIAREEHGTLDIYSTNMSDETEEYLAAVCSKRIRVVGGIRYFDLPWILKKYDVGLILYKGHIPNYIFNAPNKLFEYMACGLDVWFPDVMVGCSPYQTAGVYPQVLSIKFEALSELDLSSTVDRNGLYPSASSYCAEEAYKEILHEIELSKTNFA